MYELIDSHCHLDFESFEADFDAVITRAAANGVTDIIIPGVSVDNWSRIKYLCANNQRLHPCYGLHPYLVEKHSADDLDNLTHWVSTNHCVAIGECGLDYRKGMADRKKQMLYFQSQLDIAQNTGLPVVIHSVHATEDVIKALRAKPGLRGMIHSYSGSYEQALSLIEHGYYISLGGPISYVNSKKIRDVAARLPLTSILLETDAPDQPDAQHSGERNEPAYLLNVLESLSALREESIDDIAAQTSRNARALFNI